MSNELNNSDILLARILTEKVNEQLQAKIAVLKEGGVEELTTPAEKISQNFMALSLINTIGQAMNQKEELSVKTDDVYENMIKEITAQKQSQGLKQ